MCQEAAWRSIPGMGAWNPSLPAAPAEAIAPSGEPRFGAFAGSLERVGLDAAAPPSRVRAALTRKRWTFLFAASEEAMIAAAVVEAGWFAAGFAWVLDRAHGSLAVDLSAAGLPGLNARVDDRPGAGAKAHFSGAGLRIDLERLDDRYALSLVARNGIRADVLLDTRGAPDPFVLVTPIAGPGVRVTQKAGALAATGAVQLGGRTLRLEGGMGGVDATHGYLARETAWRWAFGTGRLPGGAPVAFNLAEGFAGVPAGDPGENALFGVEGTVRLPPVFFAWDRDHPLTSWRVRSADGTVDLAFAPIAVHREVKNLGVLRSRFAQVAGTFTGRLPGERGPIEVAGLPGVVEDHWARW